MEEITSSFLLFKKKEKGKFWKFLYVYAFGIEEGVFPNAKEVLLKANVTLKCYGLLSLLEASCLGRPMHEKEGKFVENGS